MTACLRDGFGNPSSVHAFGQSARRLLDRAREQVATLLNASPEEILFTSGGTEADNQALRCGLEHGGSLVTSVIEHPGQSSTPAASWRPRAPGSPISRWTNRASCAWTRWGGALEGALPALAHGRQQRSGHPPAAGPKLQPWPGPRASWCIRTPSRAGGQDSPGCADPGGGSPQPFGPQAPWPQGGWGALFVRRAPAPPPSDPGGIPGAPPAGRDGEPPGHRGLRCGPANGPDSAWMPNCERDFRPASPPGGGPALHPPASGSTVTPPCACPTR